MTEHTHVERVHLCDQSPVNILGAELLMRFSRRHNFTCVVTIQSWRNSECPVSIICSPLAPCVRILTIIYCLLSFSIYLCSSLDSKLLEGRGSILLTVPASSTRIRQLCKEGLP